MKHEWELMNELLAKATAADPADRFPDIGSVAAALEAAFNLGVPVGSAEDRMAWYGNVLAATLEAQQRAEVHQHDLLRPSSLSTILHAALPTENLTLPATSKLQQPCP